MSAARPAAAGVVMPIVQLGAPVLRRPTPEMPAADITAPGMAQLIASMRATMYEAPGVGLAAPQVGLGMRLAVLEDRAAHIRDDPDANVTERSVLPFTVMINARYEPVGDRKATFFEGCLSMDGWRALVERHHRVRARWTDERGRHHDREFSGWPARIVQHEIDHLDGVVYVDRCLTRTLMPTQTLEDDWADLSIDDVRARLGA